MESQLPPKNEKETDMAVLFTFPKFSASSSFVLAVLLFCISSATITEGKLNIGKKLTRGLVAEVCIQTRNPNFCLDMLENDPRTEYFDLFGLASIALNHAFVSATDAQTYNRNLFDSAPPELKRRYQMCDLLYQVILDDLRFAGEELDDGKYGTAKGHANDIGVRVDHCENVFTDEPKMQSPLAEKNQNLGDITDILVCAINRIL
ncbi:pectinesterase inhibitor-like [Papaver somniferum]|uniref:pectinesterase inhibitor-like n=1 Tax=Papaver somniferum TaxID=3469 RepID=UPI000E700CDD|nr:pectinesterase inhibitor-like [Papaver somniferum]